MTKTKANKVTKTNKQTKTQTNKQTNKQKQVINCGARTCDPGLWPYTCVTGA